MWLTPDLLPLPFSPQNSNHRKSRQTNRVADHQNTMCIPTVDNNNDHIENGFAKYQEIAEYPPDKEGTWPYSKEDNAWVHAHNSIRAEMDLLIIAMDGIRTKPFLSATQISCLQQAWQCHYDHVQAHHTNVDELLRPFLETRFEYPKQDENDHTALVAKLEALHSMVAALSSCAAADGGENNTSTMTCKSLVRMLREYQSMMLPQLAAKEDLCLSLVRAYFTPEEMAPMLQEVVNRGPWIEVGSFVGCMGVETFRTKFMVQEGISDFLWEAQFQDRYRYYQEHFAAPLVELIKIGDSYLEL
jgi:hypothetical protein